ncbi:MAG TPA: Clp protease N-terminal domain-containing protein [Gaiellaceae bacterium]|nr:Clp protease N-terminal domain-containing protein [Gaiellaceae bacterium]
MFERFTEGARKVVAVAQEEARVLKHDYLGTEHLLLGLLRVEEGLAAGVLGALGVAVDDVRAQVARIVGVGDEAKSGEMPFTPRAKKVLDLSLREALSLGHDSIGTEHLLLGLARENEGVAARILLDFGVDAETVRNEVIGMLSGPPLRSERDVAVARQRVSLTAPRRFGRMPRRVHTLGTEGREWLPAGAAGLWALLGLAVGVLLGRATRRS